MVKLKKIVLFLILMVMSINIFSFKAYADDDGYYIKNMNVNVDVNDKREFKITETIDVYFNEERHGIIRNIPKSTRLEDYNIKDVSVKGAPYEIQDYYDMKITIGDEDRTLIGDKTYKITYTMENYNEEKSEGDYIYLNVLGNQWDTKVENFTSTITYPKEANLEKINVTDGEYGSEDSKNVQYKVENNKIHINSINTIKPYNAITVNAMLNEGAFKNAPIKQYPYIIENEFIDVNITDDKKYEIQRDFQIKVNEDYVGQKHLIIDLFDMIKGDNFYLLDMKVNGKDISYNEKYGDVTLDGSRDEYNFKVSYTIEPRLSDDIVFKIVQSGLGVKLENLKVNVNSPFPINNAIVDFTEKGANYGTDRFNLEKNNNNVIFTNKNTIYDGERVKLSLDIDKNLFVRDLPASANIVKFGIPIILLIVVFLFFIFKDKNPITPVVQLYPPRSMNSAEVAYGFNESISNSQVTSLLFYWASKGYIKITMEENKKFTIEKLKEIGSNHKPYEKNLFNSLFKYGAGKKVTGESLRTYFGEEVSKAAKSVSQEFKYKKKLRNSASKKIGFLLSIISALPIILCMMVAKDVDHGSIEYIIFSILLLLLHLVFYVIFYYLLKKRHGLVKKTSKIIGVIFISFLYLMIIILPFILSDLDTSIIIISIVASLIGNILSSCVPKRTDYGKELLGEIVGFRNFMEIAEKERLEALLEEDPEYFYNTLPYAQVLGVTKKWANKFKDISMEQPSYYDTYYPLNNYIALNMFLNDLNRVQSTASHTIDNSSDSSGGGFGGGGFGGGGFSGGGSGGGGGSSW